MSGGRDASVDASGDEAEVEAPYVTPGSVQSEEDRDLQLENAETSLDQPSQ